MRREIRVAASALLALACFATAADAGCGCVQCQVEEAAASFAEHDFFTNYGHYMPRKHCLQTAAGDPDWAWIAALIALNVVVAAGYTRIFVFWRRCYLDEQPRDRDGKLMDLAWIFALCAVCGYVFNVLIFFWPAYRLLALFMVGLTYVTWRFALDLEPFRKSFTAHRLQRQLTAALEKDNHELEEKNTELEQAHRSLSEITDELRKSNQDLDEFVYAASHDLRAPLRAIESLSQFVLEDFGDDLPESPREDLLKLQGRVKRMDRMLNGLLQYSRMQRQSFPSDTFTAREVAEDATAILDTPSGFRVELPECELELTSPQPPLEQVIRNLVDNALKHHDRDDGTIRVDARAAVDAEGMVEFSVSDDGPGIDPEDYERVFELFQTLRRRDEVDTSGMGLALVKRTVEAHGGRVSIEEGAERGVTFRFTWPLIHLGGDEAASGPAEPQPEEPCHA